MVIGCSVIVKKRGTGGCIKKRVKRKRNMKLAFYDIFRRQRQKKVVFGQAGALFKSARIPSYSITEASTVWRWWWSSAQWQELVGGSWSRRRRPKDRVAASFKEFPRNLGHYYHCDSTMLCSVSGTAVLSAVAGTSPRKLV